MKKYFVLIFLFFLSNKSPTQGSLYATMQAGPSLAFSNFDFAPGYSPFDRYSITASKLTSVFGAGVGYAFPGQIVKAETGIYRTFPHMLLDLDEWKQPGPERSEEKVYIWYHSWQAPLRLKLKLWQPSEKITFRVLTGAVFTLTQSNFKMKGDVINVAPTGRTMQGEFSFQTNQGAAKDRTNIIQEHSRWAMQSSWVIETGLEASYKIAENLDGLVSLVFQNGLQTRLSANVYVRSPDPETGQYVNWLASENTSDGNALNLNIGVAYSFGK